MLPGSYLGPPSNIYDRAVLRKKLTVSMPHESISKPIGVLMFSGGIEAVTYFRNLDTFAEATGSYQGVF